MTERRGYETMQAKIAEMTTEVDGGDIHFDIDKSKVEKILSRDNDPMFVTIQVAREGKSGNGKIYTAETMQEIAEQINNKQPDGYKGHLTDKERETKAPDANTIWLGAKVMKDKEGKTAVYAKGYVMPYATKHKQYLQTAHDLGKNVAVSIFGKAQKAVYNVKQKAYDIVGIMVESVDWARPGAEGIPNDGTLILTSEMQKDPKGDTKMTREEVIKSLTADELREHNADLVSTIESDSKKDMVPVAEMTSLQTLVGAEKPEETETKISEMQKELNTFRLNQAVDSKVAIKAARPVIKKMAIAEMKSDVDVSETVDEVLKTDQAQAIIKEMSGTPKVNPTNDERSQPSGSRKYTQAK